MILLCAVENGIRERKIRQFFAGVVVAIISVIQVQYPSGFEPLVHEWFCIFSCCAVCL